MPTGNINILRSKINGRRKLADFLSDITLGLINDILSKYIQGLEMDTEEEPATLCIEKGATRLHSWANFGSCLLNLQDAALVPTNDGFDVLYVQSLHDETVFNW